MCSLWLSSNLFPPIFHQKHPSISQYLCNFELWPHLKNLFFTASKNFIPFWIIPSIVQSQMFNKTVQADREMCRTEGPSEMLPKRRGKGSTPIFGEFVWYWVKESFSQDLSRICVLVLISLQGARARWPFAWRNPCTGVAASPFLTLDPSHPSDHHHPQNLNHPNNRPSKSTLFNQHSLTKVTFCSRVWIPCDNQAVAGRVGGGHRCKMSHHQPLLTFVFCSLSLSSLILQHQHNQFDDRKRIQIDAG